MSSALDPTTVRSYFNATPGWSLDRDNDRRSIWVYETGARSYVPNVIGPDTPDLLRITAHEVADAERRDPADVEIDFTWPTHDRFHLHREAEGSALPIDTAIELQTALHDVILAAARSETDPGEPKRAYPGGRRPQEVNDYLDGVMLIPSQPGSFVVRALLPLTTADEQPALPIPLPPSNDVRRISVAIVRAAEAAVTTAALVGAGASLDLWDAAVAQGVNSNLCDALARLPGSDETAGSVELRAVWTWAAPAVPLPPVSITPGQASLLDAAADYLQDADEEHVITITGLVTKLHRERALGPGEATIKGFVENWDTGPRTVRIELDEQTYSDAVGAHDNGQSVRLRALVKRTPHGLRGVGAESFRVIVE